jgi:hypothetical protein
MESLLAPESPGPSRGRIDSRVRHRRYHMRSRHKRSVSLLIYRQARPTSNVRYGSRLCGNALIW